MDLDLSFKMLIHIVNRYLKDIIVYRLQLLFTGLKKTCVRLGETQNCRYFTDYLFMKEIVRLRTILLLFNGKKITTVSSK